MAITTTTSQQPDGSTLTVATDDATGREVWRSVFRLPSATEQNRQSITDQARQALDTNRAFTAISAPTNAQVAAEVKALARQNNGIIRLLLGLLDGTD